MDDLPPLFAELIESTAEDLDCVVDIEDILGAVLALHPFLLNEQLLRDVGRRVGHPDRLALAIVLRERHPPRMDQKDVDVLQSLSDHPSDFFRVWSLLTPAALPPGSGREELRVEAGVLAADLPVCDRWPIVSPKFGNEAV